MAVANYLSYIVGIFREDEGLSIVFHEDILEEMKELSDKEVQGPFAMVTADSGTSLPKGIEVKAFSAYYHEHLLVPYGKKEEVMKILENSA